MVIDLQQVRAEVLTVLCRCGHLLLEELSERMDDIPEALLRRVIWDLLDEGRLALARDHTMYVHHIGNTDYRVLNKK